MLHQTSLVFITVRYTEPRQCYTTYYGTHFLLIVLNGSSRLVCFSPRDFFFPLLILFALLSSGGSTWNLHRAAFKHCPLLGNTMQNSHHIELGVLHDCELCDPFLTCITCLAPRPPEEHGHFPIPLPSASLSSVALGGPPLWKRCTQGSGLCCLAGDYIPPVRDSLSPQSNGRKGGVGGASRHHPSVPRPALFQHGSRAHQIHLGFGAGG